jgi:hypothetical protein
MSRLLRLAAVVIPLAGLTGLWVTSDSHYRTGTEWEVPIEGYDPRDLLRGHYVEFTYDWPGVESEDFTMQPPVLCLAGKPPRLDEVFMAGNSEVCTNPLRAAPDDVYGLSGLERGRLYVGQERAMKLQQELQKADQRGIVTIRQREDGSFTPIAIRFRPLTPAEIAERDAQSEGAEDLRLPPPIMVE